MNDNASNSTPESESATEIIDLGYLRRRSCSRKRRHATERAAWVEYARIKHRTGTMVAYGCRFCEGWHLGHVARHPIYARIPEILAEIGSPSVIPDYVCVETV